MNEVSGVPTKTHKALQMGEVATFGKSGSLLDFMGLSQGKEREIRGESLREKHFSRPCCPHLRWIQLHFQSPSEEERNLARQCGGGWRPREVMGW